MSVGGPSYKAGCNLSRGPQNFFFFPIERKRVGNRAEEGGPAGSSEREAENAPGAKLLGAAPRHTALPGSRRSPWWGSEVRRRRGEKGGAICGRPPPVLTGFCPDVTRQIVKESWSERRNRTRGGPSTSLQGQHGKLWPNLCKQCCLCRATFCGATVQRRSQQQ